MDSTGTSLRSVVDRRETTRVGRNARLELVFARRAGKTVLTHSYAEPPFRVGRWFPDGDGVHLILVWSAPGIFGGDNFEQTIRIEQGARVRLTSQSAMQIHPSPEGGLAQLFSRYQIEEDAELTCEWDPMIPFTDARLDQRIEVSLSERAMLYWSDALMAGRVASPSAGSSTSCADDLAREKWAFAELSHELRVMRGDTLEYLERYRLIPSEQSLESRWVGDAASYFGTVLSSGCPVDSSAISGLHEALAACTNVRAAADRLAEKLAIVRLMSGSGARFRDARHQAASWLRTIVDQNR